MSPEYEAALEICGWLTSIRDSIDDVGQCQTDTTERTPTPFDRISEQLFVAWMTQYGDMSLTRGGQLEDMARRLAAAAKLAANIYLRTCAADGTADSIDLSEHSPT